MLVRSATVLPFADPTASDSGLVGRVHLDGSITFRGRTYRTLRDVPPECQALRPDVETWTQWRRLYRAVDPRVRREGPHDPPRRWRGGHLSEVER